MRRRSPFFAVLSREDNNINRLHGSSNWLPRLHRRRQPRSASHASVGLSAGGGPPCPACDAPWAGQARAARHFIAPCAPRASLAACLIQPRSPLARVAKKLSQRLDRDTCTRARGGACVVWALWRPAGGHPAHPRSPKRRVTCYSTLYMAETRPGRPLSSRAHSREARSGCSYGTAIAAAAVGARAAARRPLRRRSR